MKIICAVIGHKYFVSQRFGRSERKVGCSRCNRAWAMHDDVRAFLPWDSDFDELYGLTTQSVVASQSSTPLNSESL